MTDSIASTSPPSGPLAPVADRERIAALDILRGLALAGVVVANVWLWFSGIAFKFPEYRDVLAEGSFDTLVFTAIAVFVSGKAISTFSFLFGHGFAIQMLRAGARGRSVVPTYLRRLGVLLAIGVVHMTLFWYGDILTPYALLGFILILFRKRADVTLLVWAGLLIFGVPLVLGAIPILVSGFGVEMPRPDLAAIAARNAETLAAFQSSDYGTILRENLEQAAKFYFGRKAVFLLYLLGLFLLGLYAGRRRLFDPIGAHRLLFRRLVIWGLPIGLTCALAFVVMQAAFEPEVIIVSNPWLGLVFMMVSFLSMAPLAAAYVGAVALLLERPRWADRLAVFAPVGRMALTNYLTQTLVLVIVFNGYGLGLIGRIGPTEGLLIALALFAVQIMWSAVWLSHFRFGPMEWVWRSLTYGQAQPMRLARAPVGAVGA